MSTSHVWTKEASIRAKERDIKISSDRITTYFAKKGFSWLKEQKKITKQNIKQYKKVFYATRELNHDIVKLSVKTETNISTGGNTTKQNNILTFYDEEQNKHLKDVLKYTQILLPLLTIVCIFRITCLTPNNRYSPHRWIMVEWPHVQTRFDINKKISVIRNEKKLSSMQ